MGELARELATRIEGDVRFDRASRILYSNDASIYQIEPLGVVIPRHTADVAEAVRVAAEAGAPVLPRGGGTSLAGQAVGEAVVLDLSVHFRSILEINREELWARVQPGVVQDAFGAALVPLGLRFGPETSTSNRANLGGMIGNNSAGARSLVYGKTVDNVLDATVVLPDGSCERLSWLSWEDIRRRARGNGALAPLLRELLALRDEYSDEIRERFPRIPRRVSGYNLDVLLDPGGVNLAHLIVGSEGTLGTVVEARVKLHQLPPAVGLAVLHFDSMLPALEAGVVALDLHPTAVELVDRMVLDLARESLEYSRRLHFVEGEPGALILVEFAGGSRAEVASKLADLERRLGNQGRPHLRVLDPAEQKNVWAVRKAALPLLLSLPGDKKPIAFVEDTAVEPSRLPEFIRGFEEILSGRNTEGSFYAHAGAGCLHIRPLINLKDPAEIQKMDTLAREVCDLVLDFGGAMSGEHGDGLARSHFNEKVFGPRVYQAFRRLKAAFDPAGIMNPGKVVDAPAMTDNLRYGGGYRAAELPVVYPYERHGGFAGAVELCNGAGVCRKELVGTMCPSFMATKEEEHSTRGRANLLRALLDGRLPPERESEDRVLQALDLCLACKACKAECPSGVDMARLKSDFLHRYYRDRRRPLADRLFGAPDVLARWGSRLGPLTRWADRRGWAASLLARTIGFDRRRSLPQARAPILRELVPQDGGGFPAAVPARGGGALPRHLHELLRTADRDCRLPGALGARLPGRVGPGGLLRPAGDLPGTFGPGPPARAGERSGARRHRRRGHRHRRARAVVSLQLPRRDPRSGSRGGPSRRPGDRETRGSLRRVPGRSPGGAFPPHRRPGRGLPRARPRPLPPEDVLRDRAAGGAPFDHRRPGHGGRFGLLRNGRQLRLHLRPLRVVARDRRAPALPGGADPGDGGRAGGGRHLLPASGARCDEALRHPPGGIHRAVPGGRRGSRGGGLTAV